MNTIHRITRIGIALSLLFYIGIGPANSAGRTKQSISNTVLNGKGSPTSKIGVNGDFYIDVSTFSIYGPKVNNRWPSPVSMRGPAGNPGSDGKPGERGSTTSGTSGSRGEQGEKGEKGDKGDAGEVGAKGDKGDKGDVGATGLTGATGITGATGVQGLKGETGATGPIGSTGLTGATGLQGATGLTGATGLQGATGSQGLKGDTGTTGSQGLKGDTGATGATGATGPSNVQIGNLTFGATLSGNAGVSMSSTNFGSLEPGKSYVFDVLIWGKTTSDSLDLGLAVSAIGATPTMTTHWISTNSRNYRGMTGQRELSQFARVIVNGTSTITSYQLAVTITSGNFIFSSEAVTFGGGYSGQLVGSVTG